MRHIQFSVSDGRRWLSLFLVCCIVICGIGGIHQRAQAVVVVDDAIVAIVIAALAAMGITFTMTGGYQTVRDWIRDKITESGIDFTGVKYGASSVGSLLLNNLFVRRISAFALYIQTELGLLDNSSVTIFEGEVTSGDIVLYTGNSGSFTDKADGSAGVPWRVLTSEEAVYHVLRTDGRSIYVILWSHGAFTCQSGVYQSLRSEPTYGNTFSSNEFKDDFYYSILSLSASRYGPYMTQYTIYNYTQTELLNLLAGNVLTQNENLVADTGVIDIPDDATIGAQGGVLSLPVPWGQSMGTTLADVPGLVLSGELDGNTTLELEDASTVESQVSDTATAEQPYVGTSAGEYQSPGLSSVFPFCIPFDLYEFFECLAADPEAPEISWRFYVPGLCDEQIDIDLSQFDTVAQIVRTMELLAFIVGLALVTREKFLRG